MIQDAIAKLAAREDLTEAEAQAAMSSMVEGSASPTQVGAFLLGLRVKGETVSEIVGCARALHAHAIPIQPHREDLVDISGTGGDRSGTFNVSTTASFVVAAAGVGVAKHVGRSVSSRCGSAELLTGLGVDLHIPPERVAASIDEVGIGFLYAPRLNPALQYTIVPRRQIGIRTILDLLGPLSNPVHARVRVLGVYDGGLTERMASALHALDVQSALVVHGSDGLDELTTVGPSRVSRLDETGISTFTLDPADLGLPYAHPASIQGGSPAENVLITRAVLNGAVGATRDIVLLNAAGALVAAGAALDLRQGLEMAAEAIDSGQASQKLSQLIDFTQAAE